MIPRIYMASKMQHAETWRKLYNDPTIHICSRWPFLEPFIDPTPANSRRFWQDDMADILACDALLVYALPGEHLRGALVEAGAAIALGKLVLTVGDHVDYGTWAHHPCVLTASTLSNAIAAIKIRFRSDA